MHRGLTLTAFDIDTLIDESDGKLSAATQPSHSLCHLLPPKTSTKRQHPYLLPTSQFKNCYISQGALITGGGVSLAAQLHG